MVTMPFPCMLLSPIVREGTKVSHHLRVRFAIESNQSASVGGLVQTNNG